MKHRFYLAAAASQRPLMRQYHDELIEMGHMVRCRWVYEEDPSEPNYDGLIAEHKGVSDFQDIDASLAVIIFTNEPSTTGGYHVEFGYGFARGRTMIIVGPLLNVFHKQAHYHFENWDEFKKGYPW